MSSFEAHLHAYPAPAHRPLRLAALALAGLFSLGCFCGGLTGLGSSASEAAQALAEHQAGEEGVPAEAFGADDEVALGDWSYRLEAPLLVTVEADIAYIQNSDERAAFARTQGQGLVLPYALRNDSPLAADIPHSLAVVTAAGEKVYGMPYNAALWAEANGRTAPQDLGTLPAGTWTETVRVYPVAHEDAQGALAYLAEVTVHWEDRDRDGDKETRVRTLHEHAVVDLPPPVAGEAIVGTGKTRRGSSASTRDSSGRRVRPR